METLLPPSISSKYPQLTVPFPFPSQTISLFRKTIVISGASRGIGLSIAKKCALEKANIVILAKSVVENPKLAGTIFSAEKEIKELGGDVLSVKCDVRFESEVKAAIEKVVEKYGGVDILVNNASAIYLKGTGETEMKRFELMHDIIVKGAFLMVKHCLPYLKKAENPHIINITQLFNPSNLSRNTAYNLSKQSLCLLTIGWSKEFKDFGIGVNGLWPLTGIASAPIRNLFGGQDALKLCRTEDIMGDAALILMKKDSKQVTGNFFLDEQVLRSVGVKDFRKYRYDQSIEEKLIYEAKL